MVAKFQGQGDDAIMEVTNTSEGVQFYIYHTGEESVGRAVIIPPEEIKNLVEYVISTTNRDQ